MQGFLGVCIIFTIFSVNFKQFSKDFNRIELKSQPEGGIHIRIKVRRRKLL